MEDQRNKPYGNDYAKVASRSKDSPASANRFWKQLVVLLKKKGW